MLEHGVCYRLPVVLFLLLITSWDPSQILQNSSLELNLENCPHLEDMLYMFADAGEEDKQLCTFAVQSCTV